MAHTDRADRLARWWAGDIRPEVDEPRLLSYTFGEGDVDWTITWRLAPEGSGTRLFLAHAGFDLGDPRHRHAFTNMGDGWGSTVLPRLAREPEEVPTP